ncbi:MAG: SPOR domain-containing protein [Lachnospiraceae bacterium]|nr:SPOR domain-containing protein [Lachnospiraceae bacterium]
MTGGEENLQTYHVQVGAYRNRQNADAMAQRLAEDGFPAEIISDQGYNKVISGSFRSLDNAIRMERRLRRAGYPTYIIKKL